MLVFELDELRCAVDAGPVREVLRAVAVRTIPGQPDFIAGVIDLRGTIVPLLDLRLRFGRSTRALSPSDTFIVVSIRSQLVALWTDSVVDLVPLDIGAFTAREGLIVGTRSLSGVVRVAGDLVMIHDLGAFLSQAETDALAAVDTTS